MSAPYIIPIDFFTGPVPSQTLFLLIYSNRESVILLFERLLWRQPCSSNLQTSVLSLHQCVISSTSSLPSLSWEDDAGSLHHLHLDFSWLGSAASHYLFLLASFNRPTIILLLGCQWWDQPQSGATTVQFANQCVTTTPLWHFLHLFTIFFVPGSWMPTPYTTKAWSIGYKR